MFRVLVSDPPWPFNDKLPGPKRGAEAHYPTQKINAICNMPLPPLMDESVLFLWRVSSMVEEAYRVVRAWGFIPKTEIVWIKKTNKGKRWFGMGRITRAEHETCIVAVSRYGKPDVKVQNIRSTFEAEEPGYEDDYALTGGAFNGVTERVHSKKPDEFYQIVQDLYDGPYYEMYARRQRPGWTCEGLEANRQIW